MLQVTLPSPSAGPVPEPRPPQQSLSSLHVSPTSRQPLATWQMMPPFGIWAQTRLQQVPLPLPGSPAIVQSPVPPTESDRQEPAVAPAGISQRSVQQSPGLRQMSPSAWQPKGPPALMHTLLTQVCEQHWPSELQPLP